MVLSPLTDAPCFIRRDAKVPHASLGKEPLPSLPHMRETRPPCRPLVVDPKRQDRTARESHGQCFILRREGDFKNKEATSPVTLGVFRENLWC